jgi:hypothetical protein
VDRERRGREVPARSHPAGSFELSISAPDVAGERRLTRLFDVADGEESEWNASFAAGLSIAGRALDPGGKALVAGS